MPVALSEIGPFSVDTYVLDSTTSADSISARTFTLTKATFDPALSETLEITINAVKLLGDGTKTVAASGHEFYVNSATNPTSVTIETNARLNSITDSTITTLAVGDVLKLKRISNRTTKNVDYSPGSVIREADLDNSNTQIMHVAQEAIDVAYNGIQLDGDNKFSARESGGTTNRVLKNLGAPTSANDAVTKTYLEDTWLTSTDKTNSATVAGISTEVATVAGDSTEVTTLVNGTDGTTGTGGTTKNIALVNTVATNIADVNDVAAKSTEIGLLGTNAMAHATTGHLARLGTADVVTDMGLLGTENCVADMALLGTEDCVADMALLAGDSASGNTVIEDLNTLATSDIVADLNTLAHSTVVDDLAIIGATGVVDDLETCANNLATIQDFADKYRIANSAPGSDNDDGDLYYNTQTNQLNVYEAGSSAWSAIGLTQAQTQTEANNASVALSIALG